MANIGMIKNALQPDDVNNSRVSLFIEQGFVQQEIERLLSLEKLEKSDHDELNSLKSLISEGSKQSI